MYPKRSRWGSPPPEEDETIYSKEMRERLVEEDALASEEAAFMEGYEEGLDDWGEEEFFDMIDEELVV